METKLCTKHAQIAARKLKYEGCIVVEAIGRSDGLILLWKLDVKLDLLNYSQRHINVFINDELCGSDGFLPISMTILKLVRGRLDLIY